ncbi:FAD-binding oxidoreductase [Profundibacterium mesophilum]|nr:FAD-binding oxidoreductase [Profundibacterium mesophilum]
MPRGPEALAAAVASDGGGAIARGNGRAYGDSAIGAQRTISTRHLDRMLAFDPARGQLVAEAGVLLCDIIDAFLPRGWFPAVTPGTKFVTLGGMLAADVHGKNHHRNGGMRHVVDWIDLAGPDGVIRRCGPDRNSELFEWTIGGMGLTGVIVRAAIRLRRVESGWIRQTTRAVPDLAGAMAAFEAAAHAPYSVAWIDCLARGQAAGRALVMLGEHAPAASLPPELRAAPLAVPARRQRKVPPFVPGRILNGRTLRLFNALYHASGRARQGTRLVDWDGFFYPLDAMLGWNRIYGRRGFVQFQCALPLTQAQGGLRALLDALAAAGSGSFLAVLKRLGPQSGPISFPLEGYTLALDFPASARTLALMERLDRITIEHGGRFYLAKDARMSSRTLHRSDPRFATLAALRVAEGLQPGLASAQSERLDL